MKVNLTSLHNRQLKTVLFCQTSKILIDGVLSVSPVAFSSPEFPFNFQSNASRCLQRFVKYGVRMGGAEEN